MISQNKRSLCLSSVFLVVCCSQTVVGLDPPTESIFGPERIMPSGEYYTATVPDTLDLAERARLSVRGLTEFLNPEADYAHYVHACFDANPPYMIWCGNGTANWGKIAESLIMTRLMSGSDENLDIQQQMLDGLIHAIDPGRKTPTAMSRAMLALMALQQQSPSAQVEKLIDLMARGHREVGQFQDAAVFYTDPPTQKQFGYVWQLFVHGSAIRSLARWHEMTGDRQWLELAQKLVNFIRQPRFWRAEAQPKAVAGVNRAHFMGHLHSYTQALMGLIWHAELTNDMRLKLFVRDGYEYIKNFGLARIGLFGEMCATGDMTYLALKLSGLGVGDYWDDADMYVRNTLTELQIVDAGPLRQVVESMPPLDPNQDPKPETTERVLERNVGAFISDATHPTLVPPVALIRAICCTGNCTVALFFAWDSIVQFEDGTASVNLLLNRASPWLDIDSYLPYEGKVVIRNKSAERIAVRLPLWVDETKVACHVGEESARPIRLGRYLLFEGTAPGQVLTVEFPVAESEESYVLKWRRVGGWCEYSNRGGGQWTPPEDPDRYTCHFRGNTLIDIHPRTEGPGLPLYQRETMRRDAAPMTSVTRFVSPTTLKW